jgi:hypothetical protein
VSLAFHGEGVASIRADALTSGWSTGRLLRTAMAAALAVLATLPLYRLLSPADTGLAGAATRDMAGVYATVVWYGVLVLCIPALLAARLLTVDRLERLAAGAGRTLLALSTAHFAALAATFAFAISLAVHFFVLSGQPNLVDAMSQLTHARYIAAGHLAGPGEELGAFWQLQQSLVTRAGWISQYPPGHVALLALFMTLGMPWALGPFMLALTVLFAALAAERLLPHARAEARVGVLLIALSPFMTAHAAAYMNHTTAAAAGALAVWSSARARSSWRWSLLAGAAIGIMFTTRPLSALTVAAAIVLWNVLDGRGRSGVQSAIGTLAGALPFALLVAAYNAHFFGSPTTFGYEAALGSAGGLGFGTDPWGNRYGPVEAIAYTAAELAALNLFLLETPLPVVLVIAAWLLIAQRMHSGERLIAAWALLPLAAQSVYWHHGLFMGPRMLNESAPAWCMLAALAGVAIVRRLPDRVSMRYSPRVFMAAALVIALLTGVFAMGPLRLVSYTQRPAALAVAAQASAPAIVFVHGGWTSRLSMRLAAAGMRLDSVETALRQNPTCAVQAYADARDANDAPLPALDFVARAHSLPASVEISPGNRIRVAGGERLVGRCAAEAAADRLGTIDVSPLVWRGDLPGLEGSGTMFVRDLGPHANERVLSAYPERRPYVLLTTSPAAPPELAPYDRGMALLWSEREGA